jgi:serine/threonine-protein kinase RsbW
MARLVIEQGQPLWISDVSEDPRCADDALAPKGLRSIYAFPILYRGACVGVVELLSRERRPRDRSVVDLLHAVAGHLGELLHASALQAEREDLVDELLEARRRSEFLLLAAQVLSEFVDYGEMVERLARVSVPVLADLCLIDLEDDDKRMRRMAAWHADPAKRPLAEELKNWYAPVSTGHDPIMEVMRTGRSMWSSVVSDEFIQEACRDRRHYSILKELGYTSFMTVPLRTRDGEVIGTVTLVSCGSGRRFSEKDLDLAEQLAKQVGSVVSRARAYDRERRISHELQRNLLPDAIPAVVGWDVAARYRPASAGHEVGGDWYDVVPITDDLVALVVGDVEGHDLSAAKTMSHLRRTLGMLLLEERSPGRALERLNQFCLLGSEQRLATALVGMLDRATGVISFSSAGHPPPVHIRGGRATELLVPPAPPLGVQRCRYKDHTFLLDDGCLVMFTDGLIERRGIHFDDRLAALEASLDDAPGDDPGVVADFVIDAMTSDGRSADDIVVLTARRREAEKSAAVLS